MTSPAPVYWESVFQGNAPRILKGLYGSLLIRDWNFAATSLADVSPFAADGNNLAIPIAHHPAIRCGMKLNAVPRIKVIHGHIADP